MVKVHYYIYYIHLSLTRSKLAAVSAVLYGTVNGTGNSSNSIFRTSYRGDIVIEAVPSTHKQIEYVKGLEGML